MDKMLFWKDSLQSKKFSGRDFDVSDLITDQVFVKTFLHAAKIALGKDKEDCAEGDGCGCQDGSSPVSPDISPSQT